jgi:hypothetical protein
LNVPTAARLQTLDQGAAVSAYTVACEMGHSSMAMVEQVYSHLGTIRHRAEVVEYRIEQHTVKLGERLRALQAVGSDATVGTAIDTTAIDSQPSRVSR